MEWRNYPNFSEDEFKCSHCGKVDMQPAFMARMQQLRNMYGKPIIISSGYRCPEHPIEAAKATPGVHTMGIAADVVASSTDAYEILKHAFTLGFAGIGVQQKGGGRFIHLDIMRSVPRPNVWSY